MGFKKTKRSVFRHCVPDFALASAAEGNRTLISSLGSLGNNHYTTAANKSSAPIEEHAFFIILERRLKKQLAVSRSLPHH